MQTKTHVIKNNTIVTTVTMVTETARYIDFNDILDTVKIEYDDCDEKPWDTCDGYEHTCCDNYDEGENSRGFVYSNRKRVIITLANKTDLESYCYYHNNGCSKQVSRELVARDKRRILDQLVRWYKHGWEWYAVCGNYNGYMDSLGGIDNWDYANIVRFEVAEEIVAQLENDGYIVTGKYNPHQLTKRQKLQNRLNQTERIFIMEPR